MLGVLKPLTGGDDIKLDNAEMVLGRNKDCDIVLRFSDVSGHHCRLVLANGYWYVLDLRSTNGTKLNGMKVNDCRVDPGMRIAFAKHEYRIQYDPVQNGNNGFVPADFLEKDVFSRSLLEGAGLSSSKSRPTHSPSVAATKPSLDSLEDGLLKKDYSNLTLDDIQFDR